MKNHVLTKTEILRRKLLRMTDRIYHRHRELNSSRV